MAVDRSVPLCFEFLCTMILEKKKTNSLIVQKSACTSCAHSDWGRTARCVSFTGFASGHEMGLFITPDFEMIF